MPLAAAPAGRSSIEWDVTPRPIAALGDSRMIISSHFGDRKLEWRAPPICHRAVTESGSTRLPARSIVAAAETMLANKPARLVSLMDHSQEKSSEPDR